MKPGRWACCRGHGTTGASSVPALWRLAALLLVWCMAAAGAASAADAPVVPLQAQVLVSAQTEPPAPDDARWQDARLALGVEADVAWVRVPFEAAQATELWLLYLPYLYGGGRVWLNGQLVAQVTENSPTLRVRWERPLLLPLPPTALQAGPNVLLIRAVAAHQSDAVHVPRLVLGPQAALQPPFDRRLFVVRTVPVVTVVTGLVVAVLVLFIWWRRRREVLYGYCGLATLFWAVRTTTFIFDALSPAVWDGWRLLYFICTGGFIVALALFTLALAGWSRPLVTRALFAYWALGPLAYALGGEHVAARFWVAGLLPVGAGLAGVAFVAAWRQRSAETVAIALALLLAFAAGVHDQLVAFRSPWIEALLPNWSDHRLFLLHHAANLLLLVMGVLLAARFVRTLGAVEAANRTLEARVQQREREIAASYDRIAALQREQAATDERQRIMRDLHDGLGSQLFTSLSRAERGALDARGVTDTLRGAIDQMRIAIEALASEEQDFRTAFGNFHFRWDARLREAGLQPHWQLELPDEALVIAPHDALQILHIAQEALTNVVKHAQARSVTIRLLHEAGTLLLSVTDDGHGAEALSRPGSRGQANMHRRAQLLGGQLQVQSGAEGTQVQLTMPLQRP